MIGVFLAILELVRHHSVSTQQEGIHGEIWVLPGERFDAEREFDSLDYEDSHSQPSLQARLDNNAHPNAPPGSAPDDAHSSPRAES